jgi:8-oxo-dGTP pyrophosphatase MutT (NUDIX family)
VLHLIPAPVHRVALRLANATRVRWWRLRKPSIRGCRVVALDPENRVLLVRHSYGNRRWYLPGGGIGRDERPIDAAVRELAEETGCALAEPWLVAVYDETLSGAANRVHIVAGRTEDAPKADGREIVAVGFFAPDALPEPMSPHYAQRLRGWITAAAAGTPPDPSAAVPHPPTPTG